MDIALWQGNPVSGWDAAHALIPDLITRATGADLLVLPEMYLTGYVIGPAAVTEAARHAPAMLDAMRDIAARSGIGLAFGGPEQGAGGVYNAAFLVDKSGEIAVRCRKTHLWGDVDRTQFLRGEAIGTVGSFMGWKVGMAICYDVEFPELVRAQALAGAELIVVPTANMTPFIGNSMHLVPTRADENEIFVAYANYTGREEDTHYCGLSLIAGPDGAALARAGTGEEMVRATLDRAALTARRTAISHLADRRGDLY